MPSVAISPDMDLAAVAAAAGQSDKTKYWYDPSDGRLYVEGVTDAALLNAAANAPLAAPPTVADEAEDEIMRQPHLKAMLMLVADALGVTMAEARTRLRQKLGG